MNINMQNPKGIKLKTADTYCAEDINVTPVLEEITVNPTNTKQIIESSTNRVGIKKVTVNAVPTEEKTVIANGTVTPTSGKFLSKVIVNVPASGTDVSDTTATPSNVLVSKYFYGADGVKKEGTMPDHSNETTFSVGAGTGEYYISQGYYTDIKTKIILNESAASIIKSGETILGVTGTYSSGGGSTYSVVEITPGTTTLTDEQYNTLISSPFNKIRSANIICDLYNETTTELVYTANYFNTGYRVTIKKATKGVKSGSLSSLTSISSYVKNNLDYDVSNTTYALSAYQGKVLNDRLTALENGGGGSGGSGTLYQHTITYSSNKFNDRDDFGGADLGGQFSISFYSTHGHFEDASAFWSWLIGRGSINVCDGQLWGDMSGGTAFTRITVLGSTDAEKYIQFEAFSGNGEWNPIQYFLKNPNATGLTDTIIDGFRDM